MSKTEKISLNTTRDIPFSSLRLSQANVRRVQDGLSIEELAIDIRRRGLLQSLNVRPQLDAEGNETGLFDVPAGGRRFRALEWLVKQKQLAKDAPVPCIVRTDGIAEEDSLAENIQRVALNALDQFRAFKVLADKGLDEDEIAARFFVPVQVVKQRLRLAEVAPPILDAYEAGTIPLEIVMAFTVNPDMDRQAAVFEQLRNNRDLGTWRIKRLLTETTVDAADKRVRFIGLDAYVEAGGNVLRDLFTEDGGGWLSDPALLDRMVTDKLAAAADTVRAEGWKWVEVATDFPYGHHFDLDELISAIPQLTDEESTELQAAVDELNALTGEYEGSDDDLPEAIATRLAELDAVIERLENPTPVYQPEDIAIAGVFISIDRAGALLIDKGYVRPEDRRPEPNALETEDDDPSNDQTHDLDGRSAAAGVASLDTFPDAQAEIEDMTIKPLPDILHRELTAYRTLALRNAVAGDSHIALTALLHHLCLDSFFFSRRVGGSCLQVTINSVSLDHQGPDLKDCAAARDYICRLDYWRGTMPAEGDLWEFVASQSNDYRSGLLAFFISRGINALYEPNARAGYNGPSASTVQQRLRIADRIATTVKLDLAADGWTPTVDNYLGRVPKARILQAVEQGCGGDAAGRIDHLKKADMAAEAEALLKTSGWLPEPLRTPDLAPDGTVEPPPAASDDLETAEADEEIAQAAE